MDKKSSGWPARIFTKRATSTLKRLTNNKSGISQRKLAKSFECYLSYINKKLDSLAINCWKKQTIPGHTEAQMAEARSKNATLFRKYEDRQWILDDESYFTLKKTIPLICQRLVPLRTFGLYWKTRSTRMAGKQIHEAASSKNKKMPLWTWYYNNTRLNRRG